MATSTLALVLTLAAVTAVVATIRSVGRRRPWLALAAGVVIAGGVGAVQVASIVALDRDVWDLMSVVYYDAVIGVPLTGALLLALHGLRSRVNGPKLPAIALVACGLGVVPAPVGFYATHIEPTRLESDAVTLQVPEDRSGEGSLRIGVISDIQTVRIGSYERAAAEALMELDPDVVLVAGDLFQGTRTQYRRHEAALQDLLTSLDAPGGVFVIGGDTDDPDELASLVEGTPATYLREEIVDLRIRDRELRLAGVSLHRTNPGIAIVNQLAGSPPGTITVLLAHRPDWVYDAPNAAIDLVVAGHTHGGQIGLPFVGPLVTSSDVPRHVAGGGLHVERGTNIYVSTGVGRVQQGAPQVRFLAPPSVGLIELR